jgi:hypothetical protein
MLSRPHPTHGWLYLQPSEWRTTLQRQIEERDRLDDITHSGPAPAFLTWVAEQQLPALARHQHYRNQFHDRIPELQLRLANLQKQIDGGRLDLEPMAGITRREIKQLQELMSAEVVA